MVKSNETPKKMIVETVSSDDKKHTDFSEGMIRKGGVNPKPSIPRPPDPKGATVASQPQPTLPEEKKK